jgi:hypothetical protein
MPQWRDNIEVRLDKGYYLANGLKGKYQRGGETLNPSKYVMDIVI